MLMTLTLARGQTLSFVVEEPEQQSLHELLLYHMNATPTLGLSPQSRASTMKTPTTATTAPPTITTPKVTPPVSRSSSVALSRPSMLNTPKEIQISVLLGVKDKTPRIFK